MRRDERRRRWKDTSGIEASNVSRESWLKTQTQSYFHSPKISVEEIFFLNYKCWSTDILKAEDFNERANCFWQNTSRSFQQRKNSQMPDFVCLFERKFSLISVEIFWLLAFEIKSSASINQSSLLLILLPSIELTFW